MIFSTFPAIPVGYLYFSEKRLCKSLAHCKIRLLVVLVIIEVPYKELPYILQILLLLDICFINFPSK